MSQPDTSYRAQWARRAVRQKLYRECVALQAAQRMGGQDGGFSVQSLDETTDIPEVGGLPLSTFDPITPLNLPADIRNPEFRGGDEPAGLVPELPESQFPKEHRLCIIGAGVTGLYMAMILDSLNLSNVTYEILEGSNRTGGRLYTHYFSNVKHDYYDIGAMRFPKLTIMDRTFDLFKLLKIPLIPYYLETTSKTPPAVGSLNCPTMFNDITVIDGEKPDPGPDPYKVSTANKGSVPVDTVDDVNNLLKAAFGPFKDAMAINFEVGYKLLMYYDSYSTRQYLRNPPPPPPPINGTKITQAKPLDFYTIQWLETNNTSSGLFDQAFSESVIDSFDFAAPEKDKVEEWQCIDGGTTLVTEGMEKMIKQKPQLCKRVTKIAHEKTANKIIVSVAGEAKPREPYTTVFNTTSLGCLQRMDLTELGLHPSQKDAIRCLHYDDSAKVAIKFRYPWWIVHCGITNAGIGSTDLPIRTCVYPSYNTHDSKKDPAVLLCSYTWSQDATRIGSLTRTSSDETELKDLMISNLARLHLKNFQTQSNNPELQTLSQVETLIRESYITHHAFSWTHDPYTSGAFALFGPGQFSNLYPYLSRPTADSRFHIAGEASSAHHAWIVGSLDSAYASVYRFLRRFEMWDAIKRMKDIWGTVAEVEDGVKGTVHLQVALGMLEPERMVQL